MCLAIPGKLMEITADFENIFKQGKVSFGGITKEILYDNMKTVVIERNAYGSQQHRLNQIFYDFAKYHAFVPKLCRPYRAKTKGKVERFIKYLRESFFVPLYATAKQSGQELDLASINVVLFGIKLDIH